MVFNMEERQKGKYDADRFRRDYDPAELDGYYDPDPIAFTTILLVLGGLSLLTTGGVALTNAGFFNNLLYTINPALMDLAEEDLKVKQDFYRMVIVIGVVILAVFLIIMWWRYSQRKAESEKRWKRINSQRSAFL